MISIAPEYSQFSIIVAFARLLVTHLRDNERGDHKTRLTILKKPAKSIRLQPLEERQTIHGEPPDAFPSDSVVSIACDVLGEFASLDEVRIPWSLVCTRIICIPLGVVARGQVHCRVGNWTEYTRFSTRQGERRERSIHQPARELESGNCVGGGNTCGETC